MLWTIHFQATSLGQHHGPFDSPYEGSLTATVFLTGRVSSWMDFVLNPELAGGKGFGQVTGIDGLTHAV